jgi:hypothetical protein
MESLSATFGANRCRSGRLLGPNSVTDGAFRLDM